VDVILDAWRFRAHPSKVDSSRHLYNRFIRLRR
jgi:hypothetical protein